MQSRVARAAMAETGFPPRVDAEGRVNEEATDSVAQYAAMGVPFPSALATVTMSGSTPELPTANIEPARPKPVCTSSATRSTPYLVASRRDAAVALYRFDDEGRGVA